MEPNWLECNQLLNIINCSSALNYGFVHIMVSKFESIGVFFGFKTKLKLSHHVNFSTKPTFLHEIEAWTIQVWIWLNFFTQNLQPYYIQYNMLLFSVDSNKLQMPLEIWYLQ